MFTPPLGTKYAPRACALTGNQIDDLGDLVLGDDTQPTEPHQSGQYYKLLKEQGRRDNVTE